MLVDSIKMMRLHSDPDKSSKNRIVSILGVVDLATVMT
jgi:hypothetical protein